MIAPSLMGKYYSKSYFDIRSEGSLNQHIKLKHPEFYAQMSANNANIELSKRESSNSQQGSDYEDSDDDQSYESKPQRSLKDK